MVMVLVDVELERKIQLAKQELEEVSDNRIRQIIIDLTNIYSYG